MADSNLSKMPVLARQVMGTKGITLQGKAVNIHTLISDGTYIWGGFSTHPSYLMRFHPQTLESTEISFTEEGGLHHLAFDGKNLWGSHASGHISKICPETLEYVTYPLRVKNSKGQEEKAFAYVSTFDGKDLWIGLYNNPGRLLRLDCQTGEFREIVISEAPSHSIRSLAFDGQNIWTALYTYPTKMVKVNIETERVECFALDFDLYLGNAVLYDGEYIWVGTDTMPAKLVRINPSTHEFVSYTLHPKSSCVRGLAFDGESLWAGLYTEPGELVKFDPVTKESKVYLLPEGFYNIRAVDWDGICIWTALQNVRAKPSALYRLNP